VKKKYLEALTNRASIELDSYVGYYLHIKEGDLIEISSDMKHMAHIRSGIWRDIGLNGICFESCFILEWDKTSRSRKTLWQLLDKGYFKDVTEQEERDKKLKDIGI